MMPKLGLRSVSVTAAATAVLALVGTAPSSAAPPQSGSGNGVIMHDEVISARVAGGNRIVERVLAGSFTGTLTGDVVERVRGVVHPDGTVTFAGTLVFTGTVDGCGTGTVTARLEGRGLADPTNPVTEATVQIVNQASTTVPVTGHGTVEQNGPFLSYSIQYSCH